MGLQEMFESPVTEAMACVDFGDFKEAQLLLDQVPEPSGRESRSWVECVQLSEQLLMRGLLAFRFRQLPRAKAMLLAARRMLNDPLALVRMDLASDLSQAEEPLVLLSAISQLQECIDGVSHTPLSSISLLASAPVLKCDPSLHALPLWHKVLRLARISEDSIGAVPGAALGGRGDQHAHVQALRLRVAQIARKQRNLNYAHRLLHEEQTGGGNVGGGVQGVAQDALKSTAALQAKMETALLCLAKKQEPLALQLLWDAVEQDSGVKVGEATAAKLLRKVSLLLQDRQMATWWQGEEAVRTVLTRIRGYSEANGLDEWSIQVGLQPGEVQRFDDGVQGAVGAAELLGGFLLHRCSAVYGRAHASGKAYAEYAAWCYGQGRYHVDALTRMSDGRAIGDRARHVRAGIEARLCSVLRRAVETSGGRVVLTTEELPGAHAVHGHEGGLVLTDAALCDLAGQLLESWLMGDVIKDEGDADRARERERQAVATSKELVPWAGSHVIDALLIEWRASRHRALHLYRAAVSAYFQYLRMGSAGGQGSGAEGSTGENGDQTSAGKGVSGPASGVISEVERRETYDVTATLRLLRLLVKYGESLDDLFVANIDTTPPRPWRKIVPQLFARLGHNEACVRQHVRTLIAHIGADLPDAIIYPTVVGHLENPSSRQLSSILENLRLSCESRCPGLVADVQQVIRELNKCSILREDLVWSMLQDAMHKVSAGMRLMREEAARVQANQTLSPDERVRILREKYDAITRPARVVLEPLRRLFESRSHVTEEGEEEGEASLHDIKFVERFGPSFAAALESLRNPRHVYQAEAAWEPMRALMKTLNVYMRHSRLSLQALSPVLAGLADTRIPMPGLAVEEEYGGTGAGGSRHGPVTVARLEEHVQMLMTKTKPKKLTMVGSDGRAYTYLLKGREDLHLDERMMQLLDIVNILLLQDRPSHARGLRARSYAVIPVGPRSGLIQWADGTEPLFGIYKSWQARQSADGGVRRPSDLFYDKIIPALKEHGITRATSRQEWPHDVLRNVFQRLLQETPRDLVSRQIWCSSASSAELWNKTSTHARSMAVSSMVGYVVGLGDRHLDNILINFTSGEVVHIDWNVSFDKGARLKVPETVPYRMTQTLVAALGPYGVEGPFRNSCEKALRVLRRNKEALLTLLEAFVYDPLVDWTSEKNKDESKGVELHVSLSLFASRVDEMKVALGENLQEGVQALGALEHAMREFVSAALTEAAGAQEAEDMTKLEREVVEEIRRLELKMKEQRPDDPSTQADSLKQRLQHLEAQWHAVQAAVREGLMQVSQTAMKQESAFTNLRSGRLQTLRDSLSSLSTPPIASLASLGAKKGKGADGVPLEEQAATAFTRALECGKRLLEALGNYAQAVAELPPDYWRTGRAWQWREALSAALQNPSAVSQLCLHFSCSEERMRAQRTELLAVQSRLEADLVAAQSNARDMHAALLAASDPCEPQLLEEAVSAAHAAWARHGDRPSLGHAACALQLCDTMARVLGVSLPESSSTKELALLKAAPEEWSAPSHSELLAMVAQVWGVGPQTSRLLHEMMQTLATNINRCGDIVREMSSISAAAGGNVGGTGGGGKGRGAGKGGGGSSVGNVGEEVWVAAMSGLETCLHSISHLEVLGSDPQGSSQMVLAQAIRAIHTDGDVIHQVRALLLLAAEVRTLAQALDEVSSQSGTRGMGTNKKKADLLGKLRGLQNQYDRLIALDGPGILDGAAGGGGGAGGNVPGGSGARGRVLLTALNRVFAPVEAAVSRLTAISNNVALMEEDILRWQLVVKIEAMQVVLVAAMRCPSAAAAQTLVPAMQARLELTVAEVVRGLLLPKVAAVLRPILERNVPPAVLAGGVANSGVANSNSWAVQRTAAGGGGDEVWVWSMLGALRWSLTRHVETRRREARLSSLESKLIAYCQHQAERRKQVNQRRLATSSVMRHQAQAQHLQTQVASFRWLHHDVLDADAEGEGAKRAALLHALTTRLSECAAAHAALSETDAALTRAEEQLLRSAGSKPQNMNKDTVTSRALMRRGTFRELGEMCVETLGVAAAVTDLEQSRGLAPAGAQQMDAHYIACMARMEESWRAVLQCRHEAQHKEAMQREVHQQLAMLGARLDYLRTNGVEQRKLSVNAAASARRVLGYLPATFSRTRELLRQEDSLVGDTQQGLDAVLKITQGLDSLEEIHSMAVALECEQHALQQKSQELQAATWRVAGAIEIKSTAAAAVAVSSSAQGVHSLLDLESAQALMMLAADVLACMHRWHRCCLCCR